MKTPAEIVDETDLEETPSPPSEANYRAADVQGAACAHCAKFNYKGVIEDVDGMVPVGTCDLYEVNVRGDFVSDGFTESSPPNETEEDVNWEFSDPKNAEFAEIHFGNSEQNEQDGFIRKTILRTGVFPETPTGAGLIKKPLRIVRNGLSDMNSGTVSLEEIKRNFDEKAIPRVQIPLSDDSKEHKNTTRLNTGFVEEVEIEEDEDGEAKLVAKMNFTEPDVRDKVLRGTYADVSCGIPWQIRSRGKTYGSTLEHVALTNKPYLPDLGPFLAASDQLEDVEVSHFSTDEKVQEALEEVIESTKEKQPDLSHQEQRAIVTTALNQSFTDGYTITDIKGTNAYIHHPVSNTTWTAPFFWTNTGANTHTVIFKPPAEWQVIEKQVEGVSAEEAVEPPTRTEMSELEHARRLREVRLSQGKNSNTTPEVNMPLSREELDRLELSDEQRVALSDLLDENAQLRRTTREAEVAKRIEDLKKLGLEERPGALKLYETIALSDDGGAAAVLLSDSGQKEQITALEILDRFIEAIKGSDEKVHLSDQHLVALNDDGKPPVTADGEVVSLEDRLAAAKQAIGES